VFVDGQLPSTNGVLIFAYAIKAFNVTSGSVLPVALGWPEARWLGESARLSFMSIFRYSEGHVRGSRDWCK
jgi:hypothetical protein